MADYELRSAEREALISWLDRALDMDPPLCSICIDRKVGRSSSQQGELQAEELAILASQGGSSAILDDISQRWCVHGGRWQIRLMIEAGDGIPKRQLKRSFDMVRVRAAQASGSKGSAQGVEELTRAFADGFAAQVSAQQEAQTHTQEALMSLITKSQEFGLIRLQESTQYQARIDTLSQELMKAQISLAIADQQSALTPEVLTSLLPGVLQLLNAAATRLLGTSLPLREAPAAPVAGVDNGAPDTAAQDRSGPSPP